MPNLVRILDGRLIARDWRGEPPVGYRVEEDAPQPITEDIWNSLPELVQPATTATTTTTATFGAPRPFDWVTEYAQISVEPRLTRTLPYRPIPERDETPRNSSYKQFEQPLGRIHGKSGFQESKTETYIGLELENEALNEVKWPSCSGWDFHQEGSLRGHGFEYVQHNPAPIPDTFKLLGGLLKVINTTIGEVSNSIRTSTHVHFDCTQYNFLDIVNFSCLYWMLESFLSHYCGDSRKGNLFCLRLKDASAGQILLQNAISSGSPYSVPLIRNDYRYSSLNFSSLAKFGSLEFRMLRGTTEYGVITNWVNALECIKQYALQFKTPLDLRNHFIKDISAKELPVAVLGKDLSQAFEMYLPKEVSVESEIREGFLSVSGILSAHKTWDFTDETKAEKEQELRERKELEEYEAERARARARAAQQRAISAMVSITGDSGPDETPDQAGNTVEVQFREYTDE